MTSYQPNIAIHPGRTLREMLDALKMSQVELSERTGLTTKTINEIVQEKGSITSDTAIKLSAVFGMSSIFWNNLQKNYEVALARIAEDATIEKEIPQLKKFQCYKELVELGMVKETKDKKEKVRSLLNFFGVSSLHFVADLHPVAFRKTGKCKISQESIAAWLRCGELLAKTIKTESFDAQKISESIKYLRSLTLKEPDEFQELLIDRCSSFGVAVVIMPAFKNTGVSAAVRWLASDRALMQLTIRGSYSDVFWFNFFHELGHLLRHGKKDQFIEFKNGPVDKAEVDEKEKEADAFARTTLIPDALYRSFKNSFGTKYPSLQSFAKAIGVSTSVVAGRYAHETGDYKNVSRFRDRFIFKDKTK